MDREKTPEHMIELAKQLRQSQTDAEKLLWYLLRNRQLANAKFRRQHPIEGYIADFYSHEHRLVVELDGSQHLTEEGIKKDTERTARLNELGIQILRFNNRQVFTEIEAVLQMIYEKVTPSPQPSPGGERGLDGAGFGNSASFGIGTKKSPLPLGEG